MKKKLTYGPNDVVVVWARLVRVAAMCCRGGSRGTCGCGVLRRWWRQGEGEAGGEVRGGGGKGMGGQWWWLMAVMRVSARH
jgi:hypothetical protein